MRAVCVCMRMICVCRSRADGQVRIDTYMLPTLTQILGQIYVEYIPTNFVLVRR